MGKYDIMRDYKVIHNNKNIIYIKNTLTHFIHSTHKTHFNRPQKKNVHRSGHLHSLLIFTLRKALLLLTLDLTLASRCNIKIFMINKIKRNVREEKWVPTSLVWVRRYLRIS